MASPFKTFRKHEKKLIVFFGILLMISFLVVPPLLDWFQYAGQSRDVSADTVFTWKDGEFTRAELAQLRYENQVASRFTADVWQEAREKKGLPQVEPFPRAGSNAELVTRMLLAKKAEEMGVVVDDAAISVYLNKLGDGRVSAARRGEIFANITEDGSQARLMEQLRLELLAREMDQLALTGLGTPNPFGGQPQFHQSPLDEWESYNGLFRNVRADLYPVAVEKYVKDIAEPTAAEVQKYYDEYKDQTHNPYSPEPGFRVNERSRFAYVKGEFDKFLAEEKQKVSAEAVQKYYDENKDALFVEIELPNDDPDGAAKSDGEAKDGGISAGEKKEGAGDNAEKSEPAPAPPSGDNPETSTPTTPGTPEAEGAPLPAKPADAPAAEKPATETPATETPATETPATETPAQGQPSTEKPEAAKPASDGSALIPAAPVGDALALAVDALAALQEPPPPKSDTADAPAETKTPAEKGDAPPAGENPPATEKPAEDGQTEKTVPPATGTPPAEAEKTPAGAAAKEEPPPPKYKPLAEVEDQIRDVLADREAARKKMLDQIETVQRKVKSYADKDRSWRIRNPDALDSPDRPVPPQATELVKGTMLSPETTELLDPFELDETELGKAEEQDPNGFKSFDSLVYDGDNRTLYTPYLLRAPRSDSPTNVYSFWRTEYKESYVPPLDDIRAEVVSRWKLEQARPLAEKAARELADKARKQADESLERSLGPAAFTTDELSRMMLERDPRGIPGVGAVDSQFLSELFQLEPGDVGVAMDSSKTHAYVMRLAEETSPQDERFDTFMRISGMNAFRRGGSGASPYLEWFRDLEKEMDLDWKARDELNTDLD